MKKIITVSVSEEEYTALQRYSKKRRYPFIGNFMLYCTERYIRQYPEFGGDRELGLHLEEMDK